MAKKKKTTIFCGQAGTPGWNRKERRTPRRNSDRSPKARSRHVISAAPAGGQKRQGMREHALRNGTPGGNRTHNGPLGAIRIKRYSVHYSYFKAFRLL